MSGKWKDLIAGLPADQQQRIREGTEKLLAADAAPPAGPRTTVVLEVSTEPHPESVAWQAAWREAAWPADGIPEPNRLMRFVNRYNALMAAAPREAKVSHDGLFHPSAALPAAERGPEPSEEVAHLREILEHAAVLAKHPCSSGDLHDLRSLLGAELIALRSRSDAPRDQA